MSRPSGASRRRLSSTWQSLQRRLPPTWSQRWETLAALRRQCPEWRRWEGYCAAILGTALATAIIGVILSLVRVSNISLVYLIVVLWLAAVYGRGPAILSSLISFLAYDFYFIPPLHRFTIDDPTEWVSLGALLATSLVLGQLTAAVQSRARGHREPAAHRDTLCAGATHRLHHRPGSIGCGVDRASAARLCALRCRGLRALSAG